ncbi:MAG TPA: four helix bundle protein [Candidatus Angelobacter sp.]|nr:four helix bundle protein [Candidatus Angelobacter sp.]
MNPQILIGEMKLKDFKELKVWNKAYSLALVIYEASRSFPREEMYGLTSQLRRAAVSIGANIAEGCGRRSDRELVRFLQIARGSASEVEHHLLLARDLKFLQAVRHQDIEKRLQEVQRMLTSLVSSVQEAPEGHATAAGVTKG